jgi:hypothetical protein
VAGRRGSSRREQIHLHSTARVHIARRFARELRQLGVQECPSIGGWRLLLVASQENTWIELRSNAITWSGEHAIVYDAPIGLFPKVGASPQVEWRLNARGVPTALIFRVAATSRTDQKTRVSRLFVVRLEQDRACVVGRVTTNAEARALADGPARCPREDVVGSHVSTPGNLVAEGTLEAVTDSAEEVRIADVA